MEPNKQLKTDLTVLEGCESVEENWQHRFTSLKKQLSDCREALKMAEIKLEEELAERQRLAKNLHDAVNQSLFSAGLIAEVLPRLAEKDPEAAKRSMHDLQRLTFGALAEVRILFAEFNPAVLADSDFGDLLKLLGNLLAGRMNIPVTIRVSEKLILPPEVQSSLYTLCKAHLDWIARTAKASQVEIEMKTRGNTLMIHLVDNGLIPDGTDPRKIGTLEDPALRQAAERIGAVLEAHKMNDGCSELLICWKKRVQREKKRS